MHLSVLCPTTPQNQMVGHLITSEDNQQATTINTKYSIFVYNQSSQATTEDRRKMITPSESSLHLDSYKIIALFINKQQQINKLLPQTG